MNAWLVSAFQVWSSFAQNNPQLVPYMQLLGGKLGFFIGLVLLTWIAAMVVRNPGDSPFAPTWGMGAVVEIFCIFVAFQAMAIFLKNPMAVRENLAGIIDCWTTVEYLFLFVLIWVYLRFILKTDLSRVGWDTGSLKHVGEAALKGMLFIVVIALFVNFLYWTEILARSSKIIREVSVRGLFSGGTFSAIHLILVLLISPVAEETLYRGFIYPALRKSLPAGTALVFLSLFFAAIHFQTWFYLILLFCMSAAATLAFEKTQRLVAPVAIHIFYNGLVVLGCFSY